jgi:hypothetical protein
MHPIFKIRLKYRKKIPIIKGLYKNKYNYKFSNLHKWSRIVMIESLKYNNSFMKEITLIETLSFLFLNLNKSFIILNIKNLKKSNKKGLYKKIYKCKF